MRSWNPLALVAAVFALIVAGCQPHAREPAAASEPATERAHEQSQSLSLVIARNAERLMGIPGVVGVYEGETAGRPVLRVMVVSRADSTIERIPKTLEGYEVEIEVGGPVKPMNH